MPVNVKAQETRPVLRIFISSTAVDLIDYREKVRDAVLRLEGLPIAMETFSAKSGQPADECMRMAAEADAVICIVAHRYGYVPPKELGGDGERSITWLEVDAAKTAKKPVFAFLVDPKTPWTEVKEQDRLTSEPPEKAAEIIKAVQDLQRFKTFLQNEYMRGTFTNKDELATLAAIAVANFVRQPGQAPVSTTRIWKPLFCHALQPAQHFRGREAKLQDLKDWLQAPVTPDRVLSVVAAGGTGKTALVDKALHETRLSDRFGVFVWSFYEDPRTDAFLRAAYLYFTDDKSAPAGGVLQRLQLALSGDDPHVLILDGLERVQSEGDHRRLGELEDLQLKLLMRALAGGVGCARALVTSRFPLADLDAWIGAGHRAIVLDDLERSAALDLLRAWSVKGDDTALTQLLKPLDIDGCYHALSVAVLGSYLGHFMDGDPRRAPNFSLDDAKGADPKARRLSRILEEYAQALTSTERNLLAYLSLFPNGVQVEILGLISRSVRRWLSFFLINHSDTRLLKDLERLKELGLVFRSGKLSAVYSAHPFLRDFFRTLLGTTAESVHEAVRAKLAPSLDARPSTTPKDPPVLDRYEMLIEQTLLAGRTEKAFRLYQYGLGCYENLHILGENVRGLRILEQFVPQDDFSRIEHRLPSQTQSHLVNDLGLFAGVLGDLSRARDAYSYCRLIQTRDSGLRSASVEGNHSWLEYRAGNFPLAVKYAENAVTIAIENQLKDKLWRYFAALAASHVALGNIETAAAIFARVTDRERGINEAEFKLLRGDRLGALNQAQFILKAMLARNSGSEVCNCNVILAQILLFDEPAHSAKHLKEARTFATQSGEVDFQLRCFHAAGELQLHLGDYSQAIAEAEAGILLADTCGFGKYSIDLHLVLAETLLAAGETRKGLQNARNALDRSEEPDCQYAWGKADGLHFCGIAHLRLGERELAKQRLTAALELRERLGHGRIEETRRALELCK